MAETSVNLRGRGNQLFQEACDECLAPVVRSGRFLKAGYFYNKALAASTTEDERAKCRKNLGAVHWHHTKMSLELYDGGQASSLLHERPPSFDLERSVENYLAALRHGRASHQRREWMESIENTLQEMAHSLVEEHSWICESAFVAKLCDLYQAGLPSGARSRAYDTLQLAQVRLLLDKAVKELHRRDGAVRVGSNYANCLSLLHSCNVPLEQIQRRAESDLETLEKARLLKSSVDKCRARCESIKAREEGKRFIQEFEKTRDEDRRNHLLTCALDKFKEAASHAKGVDAECEAEALACTGDAYTEVRREEKAQSYYSAVVKLAEKSDAVQGKGFYEKARVAANAWLKRMRDGRPGFHLLPEIRADLDRIQVEFKRLKTEEFLKYLYRSYPPRARNGTAYTLGETETPAQIRIALRKALHHYHPDHNALGDDKWLALCGEITKLLLSSGSELVGVLRLAIDLLNECLEAPTWEWPEVQVRCCGLYKLALIWITIA
ncbi:hypothetical protein R1sor_012528 [Riccia sorocarpa]|uniref:J domain-containing protein n=1 Tax=Riccia sorocarpa TaxID=122646 RepID=A0ABD3I6Q1_9MARC